MAWTLGRWMLVCALSLVAFTATAYAADPDDPLATESREATEAAPKPAAKPAPKPAAKPAPEAPSPEARSEAYEDTDPRALTDFKPHLDPHGRWIDDPTYGRVWVPHPETVGKDFAPYVSSGHWALTEQGDWLWVSDYPFGWVVFHYGRWVWTTPHGWAWVAGRQYSHAWVVWRVPAEGYAHVGWAPAPPGYAWHAGVAVSIGYAPYYYWTFAPSGYVFSPTLYGHVIYDPWHLHYAMAHTHHYHAHHYHHHGRHYTHGPPMPVARVPARAVPRQRMTADVRARSAAVRRYPGRVTAVGASRGARASGARAVGRQTTSVARTKPVRVSRSAASSAVRRAPRGAPPRSRSTPSSWRTPEPAVANRRTGASSRPPSRWKPPPKQQRTYPVKPPRSVTPHRYTAPRSASPSAPRGASRSQAPRRR